MTTKPATPTQQLVPVKEIRNGIIVLKDGGYRGILMCSSVNFGLKSEEEQRAITYGFQNFLNTLDFSIQIVINSRRMDLRPYLALLEEKAVSQKTELMRIQLHEYINYIRSFTNQVNIMTKSFYVIVPYTPRPSITEAVSFFRRDSNANKNTSQNRSFERFEEDAAQLQQRLNLVSSSLSGTGVRAVQLGTEEVIELLYRSFNPGELENPIRLQN